MSKRMRRNRSLGSLHHIEDLVFWIELFMALTLVFTYILHSDGGLKVVSCRLSVLSFTTYNPPPAAGYIRSSTRFAVTILQIETRAKRR